MYQSYDLKVGYSCNNSCIHCVIKDSRDNLIRQKKNIDLTQQECFSLLQEAVSQGVNAVTITGGEATLRRDLPEIIAFCEKKSLAISLQTNGRLLSDKAIQSFLFSSQRISFVIALHGICSSIHDKITGSQGSFVETLKGIRAAKSAGKSIIIKTVLSKINMTELPLFIPFMGQENLKDINVAFPHAQGAARENFEEVVPRYSALKPFILDMAKEAKGQGVHLTFETIPFCILPDYPEMMSELSYRFKDVKCTQVHEDTFDWNELRVAIKQKGDICLSCFFNEYCEGVWSEYVEWFGFKEFSPIVLIKE